MVTAQNDFKEQTNPSTINDGILQARSYSNTDDIIGDANEIKSSIGIAGFLALSKDKASQEKINEFNIDYNIPNVLIQLWDYAISTDNIILNWKKGSHVLAYNPSLFNIIPELNEKGEQKLNKTTHQLTKKVYHKIDQELAKNFTRITRKKVKAGRVTWKEWKENALGRIECRNTKGLTDRLVMPRIIQLFFLLSLKQIIREGNFVTFFYLKRMIHQIVIGADTKQGNKSTLAFIQSMNTGVTQAQAQAVLNKYKVIDQMMMEVTDANHKHVYNAPPIEYLDLEKFFVIDKPIIRWTGVGVLMGDSGSSGKYGSDFLALKKTISHIRKWRGIISEVLIVMYKDMLGVDDVQLLWDEFNLIEPKALLERLKFLSGKGLSSTTAQKLLGFDPDHEIANLDKERLEWEKWFPVFEPNQGLLAGYYNKVHGFSIKNSQSNGDPGAPETNPPPDESGDPPKPSDE